MKRPLILFPHWQCNLNLPGSIKFYQHQVLFVDGFRKILAREDDGGGRGRFPVRVWTLLHERHNIWRETTHVHQDGWMVGRMLEFRQHLSGCWVSLCQKTPDITQHPREGGQQTRHHVQWTVDTRHDTTPMGCGCQIWHHVQWAMDIRHDTTPMGVQTSDMTPHPWRCVSHTSWCL